MSNRAKGTLCILMAALSFALMSTFVRLSGDVPSMQKAFFRNVVAAVFTLIIMLKNHEPFHPPKRSHWAYLMARAIFGTVGLLCNFYAVDHLNLSDASMLNKMSPFFAILIYKHDGFVEDLVGYGNYVVGALVADRFVELFIYLGHTGRSHNHTSA